MIHHQDPRVPHKGHCDTAAEQPYAAFEQCQGKSMEPCGLRDQQQCRIGPVDDVWDGGQDPSHAVSRHVLIDVMPQPAARAPIKRWLFLLSLAPIPRPATPTWCRHASALLPSRHRILHSSNPTLTHHTGAEREGGRQCGSDSRGPVQGRPCSCCHGLWLRQV